MKHNTFLISRSIDELNPEFYGLKRDDRVSTTGMLFTTSKESTVCELEQILKEIYCKNVSAEFFYVQNAAEEKEWLSENYEKILQESISDGEKKQVAELLIKSQAFDNFLATKFPTVKRYGGEGAESMMAFFERIFELCGKGEFSKGFCVVSSFFLLLSGFLILVLFQYFFNLFRWHFFHQGLFPLFQEDFDCSFRYEKGIGSTF